MLHRLTSSLLCVVLGSRVVILLPQVFVMFISSDIVNWSPVLSDAIEFFSVSNAHGSI